MDYLKELNTNQYGAVTQTTGPVLIIAGPGAGKTRVLTYRMAFLLENNVNPYEIMALTFTNKAARELKERIEYVVDKRARGIWAGTFHSIFSRILRVEAEKIGFPKSFSIYDTDDSTSLIRTILKDMNLDQKVYSPAAIRSRISLMKNRLIMPSAYADDFVLRREDDAAGRPFTKDVYLQYVIRCRRAGAMDFDDLLLQLHQLFQANPDNVLEKYQKRFKHILVDEFQDTNSLQYAILRYLVKYPGSAENICVVGDDAQSIYAFRGATIDNILDFEKDYKNLNIFKLEQNYRSTKHIVEAANEIITRNRRQIKKTIWTDKDSPHKIKLVTCKTDDEEGRRVADLILEQKNRFHLPNSEIAILYRTNAQSRKMEESLRRYNINYRIYGGLSFYQRKEVKDFIGYLRLTVNHSDEEALRRVINYPTRGISAATLDKLNEKANATGKNLWDCIELLEVTAKVSKSLADFMKIIQGFAAKLDKVDAYKLAREIAEKSGLIEALRADNSPEGVSRMENMNAVLDAISEYAYNDEDGGTIDTENRNLSTYLQTVSLVTDADTEHDDKEKVTLMSVHAAKGLEYSSVFVTGMEEDLFPSFMSKDDPNGLDEERRLFYVAVTRAKEHLTITYAQNRYRFGDLKQCKPSRFISEIDNSHFDTKQGFGKGRISAMRETKTNIVPTKTGVTGSFRRAFNQPAIAPGIDISSFVASPEAAIVKGADVLHLKFGKGQILNVDGPAQNRVATIRFEGDTEADRRLVLRFAKLQVL